MFTPQDRPWISDSTYYSDDEYTPHASEVIDFKILETMILYEILTLQPGEMERIRKSTAKYYADKISLQVLKSDPGQMSTYNRFNIMRGTKALIVTWMYREEVFHAKSKNKNLAARYHFPPNSVRTRLDLANTGHGSLLFANGLEHLGTDKGHSDPTCQEYHRMLVERNLYGRDFEHMVQFSN